MDDLERVDGMSTLAGPAKVDVPDYRNVTWPDMAPFPGISTDAFGMCWLDVPTMASEVR